MSQDGPETQYRKSSVAFGSTLLVGSILTGPAAPLFALTGAAFLVGTGLRDLINKQAREDYKKENSKQDKESKYKQATQENNSYVPESPETAISRRDPYLSKALLEEISRNEMYKRICEEAITITEDYLTQIKKIKPEKLEKSNGVFISVKEDLNKGLERILFGKKSNGYKINISLKENDI